MSTLALVLGDQLTPGLSSLQVLDAQRDHVLMVEVRAEAEYVPHHKKKIAFLFAAMRHFAEDLRSAGFQVTYVPLNDPANSQSLEGEVRRFSSQHPEIDHMVVTHPGEFRVLEQLRSLPAKIGLRVDVVEDTRFLCSESKFADWAAGRKQLRMEYFYREMRRKYQILLTSEGEPEGGKWNFDAENRKPPDVGMVFPERPRWPQDATTHAVLQLVAQEFADNFGDVEPFDYAVTATDARAALKFFLEQCLPHFGDHQDAMQMEQAFLYHSVIALYLNCGLLDPLETCRLAEACYRDGTAPLNAVEGFVRQILGWREFIRGVYWLKMPAYGQLNFLEAHRDLPDFYWTGATDLACVAETVRQTQKYAYSHHIQRLMVTGNFALLAGLDVEQVCQWYLAVYADAYEWVELPNTLGMALFADGGIVGSKPYAASGKYINRMSNFCGSCRYNPNEMLGDNACPFNSLYWHFLDRNATKLQGNPRMTNMYSTWKRMDTAKQAAILKQAEAFLAGLVTSGKY